MPDACTLRKARKDDARQIAQLFDIASDGLATYIWSELQGPGHSLLDVGEARYARGSGFARSTGGRSCRIPRSTIATATPS